MELNLSFLIFYLSVTLTTLNYLLDYNHDYLYISNSNSNITFFSLFTYDKFFILNSLNLNLYQTYYYPFIYIFLLITLLSIIFCLSYNIDEFMVFMFYTQVILLSGYVLFFTNSLILFFLAYEMLLVPSFFILYKFAKTRRCVEAAYLMFFYTQFGAMFLIFSFIYIFLICDSLTFSYINFNFFSQFEVNFIFITCLRADR
jgi:formate hydrogenlyase subunit 3/multisubunit Na+/H+ antiporter MnhD subunit